MPLDSSVLQKSAEARNGLFEAVMERLPKAVQASFSEAQLSTLKEASEAVAWGKHPVDIRLSIPGLLNRYYLVVVGGKERRGKARVALEKTRHPLHRLSNYLFIAAVIALGVYVVVFTEMLYFVAHFAGLLD